MHATKTKTKLAAATLKNKKVMLDLTILPQKYGKIVVQENIDILIVTKTELDASFPTSQFLIEGYSAPYRKNRDRNGGGVFIYVREDIPSKQLNKHSFPDDIEGLFLEINLRKTKWILFGSYHPPSQDDDYYFRTVGRALDIYNNFYDKYLLTGDFNAEEIEPCLSTFLYQYDANNLVKEIVSENK